MSTKLETANALYDAYMDRDLETMLELLDDDVEWEVGAFITGRPSYRGKQGIREWWGRSERISESNNETVVPTFSRDEELDDGRLLRLGHVKVLRPQDPIESEFGVLYSFRDGKISRLEIHMSHAETLRAAALES